MADPDFTVDPESEPFEILDLTPKASGDEIKERGRRLYMQVNDEEKQAKINKALEAVPERERVNGVLIRDLKMDVDREELSHGETVTFRVTDEDNDPVEGARIRRTSDGSRIGRTDEFGEYEHIPAGTDTKQFEVETDAQESDVTYRSDTVELVVRPRNEGDTE